MAEGDTDRMDRRKDDSRIDAIHKVVSNIEKILTGDGEPERGLVFRVTVLEAWKRVQGKIFWMVAGGFLASAGAAIWLAFSHKGG